MLREVPISEEIARRSVKPLHALTALLLAAFGDLRVVNYGLIQLAAKQAGERMALIYGRDGSTAGSITRVAELLEVGQFEVLPERESTVFRLKSNTCRLCPKGVGRTKSPEKLCPLAGLLAGFSGAQLKEERKDGDYCVMRFEA